MIERRLLRFFNVATLYHRAGRDERPAIARGAVRASLCVETLGPVLSRLRGILARHP